MTSQGKLTRELRRIGRQIRDLRRRVTGAVLGRVWPYLRPRFLTARPGAHPGGDRIALFVLFQPGGLAGSTLDTLRHLTDLGFAPLVVCNGGLPEADIARLQPLAWKVITRPNLGYDFGGYRDGIWFLQQQGAAPERLLVLNDTIWMPALQGADGPDALRQLLDLPADYASLSNFVYRPRSGRRDDLVRKTYPSSFCFCLTAGVWRSEAFTRYWQELPLHAHKARVVQLGEVGFGRAMAAAGFPAQTVLDHMRIRDQVLAMPPEDQAVFLGNLPVVNTRWRPKLDAALDALARGELPPADLAAFLESLLAELNPWDSMVVNGLLSGQINFVKKANLKHPENARRFLQMTDQAGIALRDTVRTELSALAGD